MAGGGAGHHYVQFQVPCGWPAATPISVDLFSPEENRVAGATPTYEEPNGNYDSTQFELYGPGATVGPGYANPAPGVGIAGTRTTYQPGAPGVAESWVRFATLSAPVACGSYVLRSQVLTADPAEPGRYRRRSERLEAPGGPRQRRDRQQRAARRTTTTPTASRARTTS